jgi:hypothetical protein
MENAFRIVVGKPEGKRPLVRTELRWEDNIKTNLKEMDLGGVHWIHLAWRRPVVGSYEHSYELPFFMKGGLFVD